MTAIFISHSSKDNASAQQLAAWLQERQFESLFLDFDPQLGIPAGRDWEKELYHQLRICRAVIVLCSEHSVTSDWCFAEVAMARSLGKKLFPIRIDSCTPPSLLADQQMIEFPHEPGTAHERLWKGLSQRFHRSADHPDARAEAYERLLQGLIKAGLDPRDLFQWDSRRPPYPGLMAFQEQDTAIFFGRDDAIREGVDAIRKLNRFGGKALLMVLGASGSGKSSLLRAGLLPNLRRDPDAWLVVDPFRPGADPFAELAIVLAGAFARHDETRDRQAIADSLRAAAAAEPVRDNELPGQLDDLRIRAGQRDSTIILSIDQFEELLGGAGSPQEGSSSQAGPFLAMLRVALEGADRKLLVVGTLRSDFLGSFQCHPSLRDLPFDELMLGPMGVDGYTRIIEGPAEVAGLKLEPGLTQRMVKDTETDDALPLLAFTLRELWEVEGREEGELTIDAYANKLHGLTGSVQRAADGVIDARPLSEAQRNDLRQAFLAMTRINEQGNYARRSVRWSDLPPASQETLKRFVEARLLVSGKESGTIEVAHEALLRNWPLLKGWLDENREFLLWSQRLQAALIEYERSRTLLRDAPLSEAERWRTATAPESTERKLIDASLAARRRQRRQRRGIVGGAFAVLAAFTAAIWNQWQETKAAQAKQYAANASLFVKSNPLRSVVHGLAALGTVEKDARESISLSEIVAQAMALNIEGFGPAVPSGQERIRSLLALSNGELISGGQDGTLRRWKDGQPLGQPIPTGQGKVYSLLELANGELISGGEDGTLRRWRDGTPLGAPIPTGQGKVYSLAKLGNGELISGGEDGTLRRWRDGRPLGAPIPTGQDKVYRLLALGNGELISGGEDGTLRRWREGQPLGTSISTGQGSVLSLVELGNGVVISGGRDGTLRRWREGMPLGPPIQTEQDQVGSLVALRNGELISGGRDGSLRRWRDGKPLDEPIPTGQEMVWSLVELGNGELVSGGTDGTLRRWRTSQPLSEPIQTDQERVLSLVVLKNGELISGGRDGTLRRWLDGEPLGEPIPTGQGPVSSLVQLENGELVSGGANGSLRRWREGKALGRPIATGQGWIRSLVALRNGELISGGDDGSLRRWRDGQPLGNPIPTGQGLVSTLVELKNGELISGGGDGSLRRWREGKALGGPIATGQSEVLSLVALKNGELISGGEDGTLRRWRDGKALGKTISTGQDQLWSLMEGRNGELLSGGNDGSLRVWRNGNPVGEVIQTGQGKILNLVELKNGQLVSASDDGTFKIFLLPEMVTRAACLQLEHHPALRTPRTPAEKEASRTCRQLPVLPPSHS
jgi:WD40 repeat protein